MIIPNAPDALSRPTHAYVKHAADDERLQTRTVYGESLGVAAPDTDHLDEVYRVYDRTRRRRS